MYGYSIPLTTIDSVIRAERMSAAADTSYAMADSIDGSVMGMAEDRKQTRGQRTMGESYLTVGA